MTEIETLTEEERRTVLSAGGDEAILAIVRKAFRIVDAQAYRIAELEREHAELVLALSRRPSP